MKYRMVDTMTLEGIKTAEALLARGWKIYRTGLFYTWFVKDGEKR